MSDKKKSSKKGNLHIYIISKFLMSQKTRKKHTYSFTLIGHIFMYDIPIHSKKLNL